MSRREGTTPSPSGVLIVDKPQGPTSHDVVARVRKLIQSRHVGHAGTLDPLATGVLVIAVGEATKLVPWLTADDKAYEATIRLGIETDTLDSHGREVARVPVPMDVLQALSALPHLSDHLACAVEAERTRTMQIPPAFSAIRLGGERAHELARAGRLEGDLPSRPVEVRSLQLTGGQVHGDAVNVDLVVEVAKGYFVRSLARDLSHALGTVGHLTALRRIRSGTFTAGEAIAIDSVSRDKLIDVTAAASRALPVTFLDVQGARAASFGQRVAPEHIRCPHPRPSAWLDESSRLVAIGECETDGSGRVLRGFS